MAEAGKPDNSKKPAASLEKVAKTTEKLASDLNGTNSALEKLLREVMDLKNSSTSNYNQAAENVKMIEANKREIANINSRSDVMETRQECQTRNINTCMERIDALEKKQMLFRKVEDQDMKIAQLRRKISAEEMTKASCIITLHGLPLPKKISEMNLSDTNDVNIIANALVESLQKQTAEYIFAADGTGFTNMAAWAKFPESDGFRYSAKTPESAKNSLIFYFQNRVQAINFENKLRGAMISTQAKRRNEESATLEMGLYADSAKVRALKGLLLSKGRMLVEGFPQLAQYRVAWRGGANRSTQQPAFLTLEVKASKELLDGERKDFFFNDQGSLVRNVWTDQCNIKLSDMDQTWFSMKPEVNQRIESKMATVKINPIEKNPKRSRDSPGTAGNQPKQQCEYKCPYPDCDKSFRSKPGLAVHKKDAHSSTHLLSSDEEEDEDVVDIENADVAEVNDDQRKKEKDKEVNKKKAENASAAEGVDDSEFSPPNSKKDKKAAKNKLKYGFNSNQSNGRQKPPPSFALHAPVPDLQRKITTFATVTKATSSKGATIPNALPVPQLL